MTVGELEGMGDDGISRQPVHGLFVWVSTRALFSTPCSIYLFARQGRNHYIFYLDTPYIPFTLLSTSISCPVLDCGGRFGGSPFGDLFSLVDLVVGEVG